MVDVNLDEGFSPVVAYDIIVSHLDDPSHPDVREALMIFHAMVHHEEMALKPHYTLVCENSATSSFGVVRMAEDSITWKPGDGAIVGEYTTGRDKQHTFLFMSTPYHALYDKAIARAREIQRRARELEEQNMMITIEGGVKRKVRKVTTPKQKKVIEDEPVVTSNLPGILERLKKIKGM
ncbi:MAG: hypothetical protein DRN95_02210 [Candidatus Hydrothermarchaeota archaeon]|nr:MAG: hypothetical protein DRN95_02210 [Candidatus Hydrothermarchaeota archaeon]